MTIEKILSGRVGSSNATSDASSAASSAGSPGISAGTGFGDALQGLLDSVDDTAGKANSAIASMVQGTGDVHEAMIALHRAESTLQLTVQVRNKLVQAYQDLMRMPI
jgi:flagellar hook-basal body complex protein FliE